VNPFNGIERLASRLFDKVFLLLENPFNGIESINKLLASGVDVATESIQWN